MTFNFSHQFILLGAHAIPDYSYLLRYDQSIRGMLHTDLTCSCDIVSIPPVLNALLIDLNQIIVDAGVLVQLMDIVGFTADGDRNTLAIPQLNSLKSNIPLAMPDGLKTVRTDYTNAITT